METVIAQSSDINFLDNVGGLLGIMAVILGGTVTLFSMLGKIRTEIAEIRVELQKDRAHMEARISSLENSVRNIKSQLNTILFSLARNRISLDEVHLDDDK
jgi:hypothetical protein